MTRYKSILETVKVWLNPKYSHTRCPVCMFVVDVNPNGEMVEHGSGETSCIGSFRNDEELAEELDRGRVSEVPDGVETEPTTG